MEHDKEPEHDYGSNPPVLEPEIDVVGTEGPAVMLQHKEVVSTPSASAIEPAIAQSQRINRRKQNISSAALDESDRCGEKINVQMSTTTTQDSDPMSENDRYYWYEDETEEGTDRVEGLEDADLHFRGYSYSFTSPDGARSLLDAYVCQKCPAIFDSKVGLTNHSKLHGGDGHLACPLCDFACTNKKTLRVHKRTHGLMPVRGAPKGVKKAQKVKTEPKVNEYLGDEQIPGEKKIVKRRGRKKKIPKEEQVDDVEIEVEAEKQAETSPPTKRTRSSARLATSPVKNPSAEETPTAINDEEKFIIIRSPMNSDGTSLGNAAKKKSSKAGLEDEEEEDGGNLSSSTSQPLNHLGKKRGTASNQQTNLPKCTTCPYDITTPARLSLHLQGHSRTSGFVCSVCGWKHSSKQMLYRHGHLHRGEGKNIQWPAVYVEEEDSKQITKSQIAS